MMILEWYVVGVICNVSVSASGVIIPFFAGIGIGIVITNHLDSNSGIGSSSGTTGCFRAGVYK